MTRPDPQFADVLDLDYTGKLGNDWGYDEAPSAPVPAPPQPTQAAPVSPPAPQSAPDVPALRGGGQVSTREQATTAIWHAFRKARYTWQQARQHEGGPIHVIEHYDPPSIAGQIKYRDGRGWVPAGQEDTWSDVWGVRYHTWWSIPVISVLNFLIWVVASPFRQAVALGVLAVTAAFAGALFYFGVI